MSKLDKYGTVWPLEPQTHAKHKILTHYVDAWFPIMAARNRRLIFMDGFAGPGIYEGGEPGSPIIVLSRLLNHPAFGRWDCEFRFLFCEPEPGRCASLQREIAKLESRYQGGWPANVHVHIVESLFEQATAEILESLGDRSLAPTLAFLDPFGVKGIPLAQVCRLLHFPKCELLVNLAAQSIRRFRERPEFEQHVDALFDSEDWREVDTGTAEGDAEEFARLFERQLSGRCGFNHILSFRMLNIGNQTSYFLVFGTKHRKGLEVMKDAMWKVDPSGGFEFSALEARSGQMVLFGKEPDLSSLADAISQEFAGRRVAIRDVEDFVCTTPFRITGHMKAALKTLEIDQRILQVDGRTRARTYPDGCEITFA